MAPKKKLKISDEPNQRTMSDFWAKAWPNIHISGVMTVFIRVNDNEGEGYDLVDYEDLQMPLGVFKSGLPQKLSTAKFEERNDLDVIICCFPRSVPYKSYFDYLDDWQNVIQQYPDQILVVYYEDLKKKCLFEVKRIQRHLGYNNDDKRLQQIIDKCSICSLRSDVDTGRVKTVLVNEDGKSILYRKGEIGDWRNHLTVAQNERFDKVIEKRLKNSMFKFQYE